MMTVMAAIMASIHHLYLYYSCKGAAGLSSMHITLAYNCFINGRNRNRKDKTDNYLPTVGGGLYAFYGSDFALVNVRRPGYS